jgi:hypothetical protein
MGKRIKLLLTEKTPFEPKTLSLSCFRMEIDYITSEISKKEVNGFLTPFFQEP